jgi:hypothetical protein
MTLATTGSRDHLGDDRRSRCWGDLSTYPSCVDGRGDAPVEDRGAGWGEEGPAWISFAQADINARLTRLAGPDRRVESHLDQRDEDIQVILTDAYGEVEEMTAFLTVLEDEIDFPVPATLLGDPVIVTGLTGRRRDARASRRLQGHAGGRATSPSPTSSSVVEPSRGGCTPPTSPTSPISAAGHPT